MRRSSPYYAQPNEQAELSNKTLIKQKIHMTSLSGGMRYCLKNYRLIGSQGREQVTAIVLVYGQEPFCLLK
jgi:hypothetical protein